MKPYLNYVPAMNRTLRRAGREKLLSEMQSMGADALILSVWAYSTDPEKRRMELEALKENCAWFREKGYPVGAWTWSFWVDGEHPYTLIKTVRGKEVDKEVCPLDPEHHAAVAEWVAELASCGVDMILLDDDYRFGYHNGGMGCICRHHLAAMSRRLGEELREEDMPRLLLTGGKNRYRDAWLAVNGQALEAYARLLRGAVDRVDPRIRIGLCSCMSNWDADGSSPATVAKLLAGENRPFLRIAGAPYWAVKHHFGGLRLQDTMEFARMQLAWLEGSGIEVVSEGDSFPRPRWNVPASYLELFDLAMLADGKADGILKYVFDYRMNVDCETGYVRLHNHNAALRESVRAAFDGKTAVGVRVWEKEKKLADMTVPECIEGKEDIQHLCFSPASRMLAQLSLPTVFDGRGYANIVFGENVTALPAEERKRGVILDARAAELLSEQGIDVGVRTWQGMQNAVLEYFPAEHDFSDVGGFLNTRTVTLESGARVESYFVTEEENELIYCSREELDGYFADPVQRYPASYRYENANRERYFVLLSDAYFADLKRKNSPAYSEGERDRSYMRQRQLLSALAWLSGRELPAVIEGAPDLYMIVKEGDGKLAVGLWNCSADPVLEPAVRLAKAATAVKGIGCEAVLRKGAVCPGQVIPPYSFVGFEAEL